MKTLALPVALVAMLIVAWSAGPALGQASGDVQTQTQPATAVQANKHTMAIQQAIDPSSAVAAYAAAYAADQSNMDIHKAYVQRMVHFGLPALAYRQAQTIVTSDPQDGLAWGVLSYVDAQRDQMPAALQEIINAAKYAPNELLVQQTAGELLAWYDVTMPPDLAALKEPLEEVRKVVGQSDAFIRAYNEAKKELQPSEEPAALPERQSLYDRPDEEPTAAPQTYIYPNDDRDYRYYSTGRAYPYDYDYNYRYYGQPYPYYSQYSAPIFYNRIYYQPGVWWWPSGRFWGPSFVPQRTFFFHHHHHKFNKSDRHRSFDFDRRDTLSRRDGNRISGDLQRSTTVRPRIGPAVPDPSKTDLPTAGRLMNPALEPRIPNSTQFYPPKDRTVHNDASVRRDATISRGTGDRLSRSHTGDGTRRLSTSSHDQRSGAIIATPTQQRPPAGTPQQQRVTTATPSELEVTPAAPTQQRVTTATPSQRRVTTATPSRQSVTTNTPSRRPETIATPPQQRSTVATPPTQQRRVTTASPGERRSVTAAPAPSQRRVTAAPGPSSTRRVSPAQTPAQVRSSQGDAGRRQVVAPPPRTSSRSPAMQRSSSPPVRQAAPPPRTSSRSPAMQRSSSPPPKQAAPPSRSAPARSGQARK